MKNETARGEGRTRVFIGDAVAYCRRVPFDAASGSVAGGSRSPKIARNCKVSCASRRRGGEAAVNECETERGGGLSNCWSFRSLLFVEATDIREFIVLHLN